MLRGETLMSNSEWSEVLANDYCTPRHHISFARAIYDRETERAYVELRRPDGGGHLSNVITPSIRQIGQDIVRKARHELKRVAAAT